MHTYEKWLRVYFKRPSKICWATYFYLDGIHTWEKCFSVYVYTSSQKCARNLCYTPTNIDVISKKKFVYTLDYWVVQSHQWRFSIANFSGDSLQFPHTPHPHYLLSCTQSTVINFLQIFYMSYSDISTMYINNEEYIFIFTSPIMPTVHLIS